MVVDKAQGMLPGMVLGLNMGSTNLAGLSGVLEAEGRPDTTTSTQHFTSGVTLLKSSAEFRNM